MAATKSPSWTKMTPEARVERARKAAITRAKKFKEEKKNRIETLDWNSLKKTERRDRIAFEQDNKCDICKIENKWNNKELKFELDHVDGNRDNEERENLRLICPNCHSQTETYKVGNNKQAGSITYTDEQIIKALVENTSGYMAMKSLGMNPHGGNYVRVRRIIKNYNLELSYTV